MTETRHHTIPLDGDAPDDLDRLFAQLHSPAAPPALIPTILARTVETAPARVAVRERLRAALWAVYGVALALVAVCALSLGQALYASGTLDYLSLATEDSDLARQSPGLFWAALGEHMPWLHLVPLVLALALWLVATVALLRRPTAPPQPPAAMTPDAAGVAG